MPFLDTGKGSEQTLAPHVETRREQASRSQRLALRKRDRLNQIRAAHIRGANSPLSWQPIMRQTYQPSGDLRIDPLNPPSWSHWSRTAEDTVIAPLSPWTDHITLGQAGGQAGAPAGPPQIGAYTLGQISALGKVANDAVERLGLAYSSKNREAASMALMAFWEYVKLNVPPSHELRARAGNMNVELNNAIRESYERNVPLSANGLGFWRNFWFWARTSLEAAATATGAGAKKLAFWLGEAAGGAGAAATKGLWPILLVGGLGFLAYMGFRAPRQKKVAA